MFLFFLAVSRPDSSNCHERDGRCTDNTSPYAHTGTFSRCARLRTPDVITRLAQGLTTCLCVCPKVISPLVMPLLNVPSTPFLPIFSTPAASLTPLTASPTPLTGIRLNPCVTLLGDGPSGHLAASIPNTRCTLTQLLAEERKTAHTLFHFPPKF